MRKKKKRGFVRRLIRINSELAEENSSLKSIVEKRMMSGAQTAASLSAIRNRVRRIDGVRIIDLDMFKYMDQVSVYEKAKRDMVEELINNDLFLDMIKVERDDSFVGIGTRVHVSIEVLTPEQQL